MIAPSNYIQSMSTRAVTFDDTVAVVVVHESRDCTTVNTFDRQTGRKLDWGMHRSPAAAFRFVDAFMAGTADVAPVGPGRLSQRYSDACRVAYSS